MIFVKNGDYGMICETEEQAINYINEQRFSFVPVGNAQYDDVSYKVRYLDDDVAEELKDMFDVEIQSIEISEEFEI